jgi:hypothetical protein
MRNQLRTRDAVLKDVRDAHALTAVEAGKWGCERETYDERPAGLEQDLEKVAAAHSALKDQKRKNMMLEETIDRLRFEMDEVRAMAAARRGGAGRES